MAHPHPPTPCFVEQLQISFFHPFGSSKGLTQVPAQGWMGLEKFWGTKPNWQRREHL